MLMHLLIYSSFPVYSLKHIFFHTISVSTVEPKIRYKFGLSYYMLEYRVFYVIGYQNIGYRLKLNTLKRSDSTTTTKLHVLTASRNLILDLKT